MKKWKTLPLSEILDFKNGLNKEKHFFGRGTPIVNYMDVYNHSGLMNSNIEGKVTLSRDEKNNYSAKKGDVFFTRTSETVDEVGVASVLLEDIEDCSFSGFVLRGRPKNDVLDNDFKRYCFSSLEVRKQIISLASYTTRALTNGKSLSKVMLSFPESKEEQKRIGQAILDTENLIYSLRKLVRKKENIKKGALQELLTGKKRLKTFSREWNGRYRKTDVGEIPSDWEITSYGDAFSFLSTSSYSRAEISGNGDIKYIHYGDIHTKFDEYLDIENSTLPYITSLQKKNYSLVMKGDVVMADASEDYNGICKSTEITTLGEFGAISGLHTFLLRDTEQIFSDGFRGLIHLNPLVIKSYKTMATGLKVFGVTKGNLKKIKIPFPPNKDEQLAIANIVQSMRDEINILQEKIRKYENIKQGMMRSLLSGEVVLD